MAVISPNVPALVVGLLACWRCGAVAVPLSARLRRFELQRAFTDAQPAAAVSLEGHGGFALARAVESLAASTPALGTRIVLDEMGEIVHAAEDKRADAASPAPSDEVAILYTSGTTGAPKGAILPSALARAQAANLGQLLGDAAGEAYGLVVPASHAFGLSCLLAGIAARATAILVDQTATVEPLLRALHRHSARVLHGSPAVFVRLLQAGAELPLRTGLTAGSSCPPGVLEAFDRAGTCLLNLYGMTEIGAASACRPEDPAPTRYQTVGRALPGYELRVAGADQDEPKEIQARSDLLPSGYHGRPWGPEELAEGGWFRTGDLGHLDAQGNLIIAGRAKELVHVGGFNVFPAEVEAFLQTHPAVAQAAVVGVPHRVLGETLKAFVVANQGMAVDRKELIRFARAGIAGYKVPYDFQVRQELPLLASGKPDRRALADSATERGPAEEGKAVR